MPSTDLRASNAKWCYTRKYLNESAILGEWGYCDPSCRSQDHKEKSIYNLASKEHSYLWNEDIFMLESFSGGHCHTTYNRKNNSFAGNRGQFYAMLGT